LLRAPDEKGHEMPLVTGMDILVIEDDPDLRALICNALEKSGFFVQEAENGAVALEMVKCCVFDLVIADVRLPGPLSGPDTIRAMRRFAPSLPCLYISGIEAPTLESPRHDEFVSKPFDPRKLVGCVWELLQRSES